MSDGFAVLEQHIANLRRMSTFVRDAAPAIAVEMRRTIEAQIAAGVGPDGTPWAPRKPTTRGRNVKRGGPVLVNAAKALEVKAEGTVIIARLTGVEARHQLGAVRGGVKRPILPDTRTGAAMPAPLARAINTVLARRFAQTMGTRTT